METKFVDNKDKLLGVIDTTINFNNKDKIKYNGCVYSVVRTEYLTHIDEGKLYIDSRIIHLI